MTQSPQSDAAANGPNAKEELYLLACRFERESAKLQEAIAIRLEEAKQKYKEYVAAYEKAEEDAKNSFYDHNQATYWKGRRDALRDILSNISDHGHLPAKKGAE